MIKGIILVGIGIILLTIGIIGFSKLSSEARNCEFTPKENIKKICIATITSDGNIYLDNCEYHN